MNIRNPASLTAEQREAAPKKGPKKLSEAQRKQRAIYQSQWFGKEPSKQAGLAFALHTATGLRVTR